MKQRSVAAIVSICLVLLIGCTTGPARTAIEPFAPTGPERAVIDHFEALARSPYRNVRAHTISDDGTYATVELSVEFRPTQDSDWREEIARYELTNIGGEWRVRQVSHFLPAGIVREVNEATWDEQSEWIAGELYRKYLLGRHQLSPLRVDSPRVRALVGFTTYGKGVWFSTELEAGQRSLLEGALHRTFTDEELRQWRQNPELFVTHLAQMYEKGLISQEALDFYNKSLDQIRAEYLEDY